MTVAAADQKVTEIHIVRRSRGSSVTRAQLLLGDMNSAVFGVARPAQASEQALKQCVLFPKAVVQIARNTRF